jgi:hypothetical protein
MTTIGKKLQYYREHTAYEKTRPLLSVVEVLLGLAHEYQGCCGDGDQLPTMDVTYDMGGLLILQSGTNVAEKAGSWLIESCKDTYDHEEKGDDSGLLPSDRVILLRIQEIVYQMLK